MGKHEKFMNNKPSMVEISFVMNVMYIYCRMIDTLTYRLRDSQNP